MGRSRAKSTGALLGANARSVLASNVEDDEDDDDIDDPMDGLDGRDEQTQGLDGSALGDHLNNPGQVCHPYLDEDKTFGPSVFC